MVKHNVVANLNALNENEAITIYSLNDDMFGNEFVEIYKIVKENKKILICYKKEDSEYPINFKKEVEWIGTTNYLKNKYSKMDLGEAYIKSLEKLEKNIIREECDVEGKYKDGIRFRYPNIIKVNR